MPFQPGNKFSPGRAPGSTSKRTQEAIALFEKAQFNPIVQLMRVFEQAQQRFLESEKPTEAAMFLGIASGVAKDLVNYAYPKLRAVEHTQENPADKMTAQQKLEAIEIIRQSLIEEIKNGPSVGQ